MTSPLPKFSRSIGVSVGVSMTLLAIAGTVLLLPKPRANAAPAPSGWVKVLTEEDNKIWYVDQGSIQGKGAFRYFWSYVVGGVPYAKNGRLVYGAAYYLSVDCSQQRYRLRYARLLDQNTKTVQEQNYGDSLPLGRPRAGTGEAASTKFVCARRR